MEEVYQSRFMRVFYEAKTRILHDIWSAETESMTDDDFKTEIMQKIRISQEKKPKLVFIDAVSMRFPISLDLQKWINTEAFPELISIGLRKIAFLSSSDLITEISIQQTMDETTGSIFESGFFNDRDLAKDWLMSNNSRQNPT